MSAVTVACYCRNDKCTNLNKNLRQGQNIQICPGQILRQQKTSSKYFSLLWSKEEHGFHLKSLLLNIVSNITVLATWYFVKVQSMCYFLAYFSSATDATELYFPVSFSPRAKLSSRTEQIDILSLRCWNIILQRTCRVCREELLCLYLLLNCV